MTHAEFPLLTKIHRGELLASRKTGHKMFASEAQGHWCMTTVLPAALWLFAKAKKKSDGWCGAQPRLHRVSSWINSDRQGDLPDREKPKRAAAAWWAAVSRDSASEEHDWPRRAVSSFTPTPRPPIGPKHA